MVDVVARDRASRRRAHAASSTRRAQRRGYERRQAGVSALPRKPSGPCQWHMERRDSWPVARTETRRHDDPRTARAAWRGPAMHRPSRPDLGGWARDPVRRGRLAGIRTARSRHTLRCKGCHSISGQALLATSLLTHPTGICTFAARGPAMRPRQAGVDWMARGWRLGRSSCHAKLRRAN